MIARQEVETLNPRPQEGPVATEKTRPGGRRFTLLLGLILLVAPSGWFAWNYRSMPHLGAYHDDAVLWLSAQSLAENHGYRIPHLPENPAQTKYPPLYPVLLSLVWRIAGAFPKNLPPVVALQWSFYPFYVGLVWLYFRRCGFGNLAASALTTIPALCPITILLSVSPMTELPFTVVLLSLMLLLENRDEPRLGVATGVLAAVAFLIRTNAIVLVASVPFVAFLQRRFRSAVAFLAPLLAAILGWQFWCYRNAFAAQDDMVSYFTSYVGFYVRTFSWPDLPHRMWVNFAAVVEALGRLVVFNVDNVLGFRMLDWLLTVTAVAGVVILFRKDVRQYPIFAVLFVAVLVLWQYPPDTRFVYPLLPLYVAGLATKLGEVASLAVETWRRKRGADRVAAAFVLSLILLLAAGSLASTVYGMVGVLPEYFADRESQRAEMAPVYAWIAEHTRPDDRFAAYDDTLLYLNANRPGYSVPLLPRLVYGQDRTAVPGYISGLGQFWREKHVDYVLVTKYDFRRDLHEVALDALKELVQDRSRFEPVYTDQTAQVYRFLDRAKTGPRKQGNDEP